MPTLSHLSDPTLVRRFQAVAEETRLNIVRLLSRGERCVCELQGELEAAQSRLSFHLKKLKEAGVIADRRQGRWVYYRLVPEALEEMRAVLGELRCCEEPGELVVLGIASQGAKDGPTPRGQRKGSVSAAATQESKCCP